MEHERVRSVHLQHVPAAAAVHQAHAAGGLPATGEAYASPQQQRLHGNNTSAGPAGRGELAPTTSTPTHHPWPHAAQAQPTNPTTPVSRGQHHPQLYPAGPNTTAHHATPAPGGRRESWDSFTARALSQAHAAAHLTSQARQLQRDQLEATALGASGAWYPSPNGSVRSRDGAPRPPASPDAPSLSGGAARHVHAPYAPHAPSLTPETRDRAQFRVHSGPLLENVAFADAAPYQSPHAPYQEARARLQHELEASHTSKREELEVMRAQYQEIVQRLTQDSQASEKTYAAVIGDLQRQLQTSQQEAGRLVKLADQVRRDASAEKRQINSDHRSAMENVQRQSTLI